MPVAPFPNIVGVVEAQVESFLPSATTVIDVIGVALLGLAAVTVAFIWALRFFGWKVVLPRRKRTPGIIGYRNKVHLRRMELGQPTQALGGASPGKQSFGSGLSVAGPSFLVATISMPTDDVYDPTESFSGAEGSADESEQAQEAYMESEWEKSMMEDPGKLDRDSNEDTDDWHEIDAEDALDVDAPFHGSVV